MQAVPVKGLFRLVDYPEQGDRQMLEIASR